MNIVDLDAQIVTITQVRRDIDVLKRILDQEKDAVVMRNQTVAFVVVNSGRYQTLTEARSQRLGKILSQMNTFRKETKIKKKHGLAADNIVKMRDQQFNKWKKP